MSDIYRTLHGDRLAFIVAFALPSESLYLNDFPQNVLAEFRSLQVPHLGVRNVFNLNKSLRASETLGQYMFFEVKYGMVCNCVA